MKSKHLVSVGKFLVVVLVDLVFPGSGLVLEVGFLLWELLEEEEEEE
jgi:hypothetical protein